MADVQAEATIFKIPIAKAGNATIDIDPGALPDEMYALALQEGLKVLLNRRMSKVGAVSKLTGDDLEKAHVAAMEIAEQNKTNLIAGEVKSKAAAKDGKIPREVATEARNLAKKILQGKAKEAGLRWSMIENADKTKYANELLQKDPSLYETARANIEARTAKVAMGGDVALTIFGGVTESPKLKAKAEKDKANRALSATQAGKIAPHKVPPAKKPSQVAAH